jgi:hypothetical protein
MKRRRARSSGKQLDLADQTSGILLCSEAIWLWWHSGAALSMAFALLCCDRSTTVWPSTAVLSRRICNGEALRALFESGTPLLRSRH